MAVKAVGQSENSHSWKTVQNQCPITKDYLKKSVQIAESIRYDYQSWAETISSWSSDRAFATLMAGMLLVPVVGGTLAYYFNHPESSTAPLVCGAPFAVYLQNAAGKDLAKAKSAEFTKNQQAEKLPQIKEELENAKLRPGVREKILSIVEREMNLLSFIKKNEEKKSHWKHGATVAAAAWMAGSAAGFSFTPVFVFGGILAATQVARLDGYINENSPRATAAWIQQEIRDLA